mgnify:CR=1 FL=1
MEPASRYHPLAHFPIKLGSVNVLEDITADQNLIIVKSGGFELIYNANNEEERIIQKRYYILRLLAGTFSKPRIKLQIVLSPI